MAHTDDALAKVEDFMNEPLVAWFSSYLCESEKKDLTYENLIDGPILYDVFLQFDPKSQKEDYVVPSNGDATVRHRNLVRILDDLCNFYEQRRHSVISWLPNVEELARDPVGHVEQAKLFIRYLLGCVLRCPNKGKFLDKITNEMDYSAKRTVKRNEELIEKIEVTYRKLEGVLLSEIRSERLNQLIRDAYVRAWEPNRAALETSAMDGSALMNGSMPEHVLELENQNKKLADEVNALKGKLEDDVDKNKFKQMLESEWKRSADLEYKLKRAIKKLEERKLQKDRMKLREAELENKIKVVESREDAVVDELSDKQAQLQEALRTIDDLEVRLYRMENRANNSASESPKPKAVTDLAAHAKSKSPIKKSPNKSKKDCNNESKIFDEKPRGILVSFWLQEMERAKRAREKKNNIIADLNSEENNVASQSHYDKLRNDYEQVLREEESFKNTTESEFKRLNNEIENVENNRKKLVDELNNLVYAKKVKEENEKLKEENEKLKENIVVLYNAREAIAMEQESTKANVEALTTKQSDYENEIKVLTEKIAKLETQLYEFSHKYNALAKLNEVLEADKKAFLNHTDELVRRMQQFHDQSLEEREPFDDFKKPAPVDKYDSLRRQKERLDEKLNSSEYLPKKKSNVVKSAFSKFGRVGSKILSRSRRSLGPGDAPVADVSFEFAFLKGSESSGLRAPRECTVSDFGICRSSFNEPRNRKSVDFMSNFDPSEFSFDCGSDVPGNRRSTDFGRSIGDFGTNDILHESMMEDQKSAEENFNELNLRKSVLIKNTKHDTGSLTSRQSSSSHTSESEWI